jgi:hypothetical protein
VGEEGFDGFPDGAEEWGVAVGVEAGFVLPMAEGGVNCFVGGIFQQLKMCATREIPDGGFIGVEDVEEVFYALFGEMHSDYSYYHIKSLELKAESRKLECRKL